METPTNDKSCEANTGTTSGKHESKSKASVHGISYQIHLGLVVLLRLFTMYKKDKQFDFELTFEDASSGKFDDVVVRYSSPKHSSNGIVRIQAKHRQNMQTGQQDSKYEILSAADLLSTKKKAQFSIGMYFNSFLDIHNPESAEKQTYMLCTNKTLDTKLSYSNFKYNNITDIYILQFLQDINAQFYQFDLAHRLEGLDEIMENVINDTCKYKNEVDEDHKTDFIKSFYNNFILVCGSANETELYDVAIGLLKELLHFQNITTFEKLHYNMFDAINKGRKSFKPNDVKKLFKETKYSFILEYFRTNTAKQVALLQTKYLNIEFHSKVLEETELFKFIADKTPGTLCYRSSYGIEVSIFIIEQTVKLAACELVLVDLSSYQPSDVSKELCNEITAICKQKGDMIITIITQGKMFNRQEVTKLVQEYGMKFVIVQHDKKDIELNRATDVVVECVDSFCLKDLTEDSRNGLLQNHIDLFGTNVTLGKIIKESDPLSYFFDLIQMREEQSKSAHETKFEEIKPWYVDRHFVSIQNGIQDYFDDQNNLPGLKDGTVCWKVNIVLNDAGFGKSSCFTKLSMRLSTIVCSSFVIRLNAIEFSTDLKRLQAADVQNLNTTTVLRILYRFIHLALFLNNDIKQTDSAGEKTRNEANQYAEVLTFSNERVTIDETRVEELKLNTSQLLQLRLFREKLNEKQLILMFDGFDEIPKGYKEVVLRYLAKFEQLDGMLSVYISSRPYDFEEGFKMTFPDSRIYKLEPFSAEEQISALCKYIRHEVKDLEDCDELLLLDAIMKDFQKLPNDFKMIPHFLRMAFDNRHAIVQKSMSSKDKQESTKQESMDLWELVMEFVKQKSIDH